MNIKEALRYSMSLCSKQERCKSEVRDKLRKHGLNETDITKVLDVLEKENFINESRYTSMFANDKLRFNGWGKIKISHMLKQKKIQVEIIEKGLEGLDSNEYENVLRKELSKKKNTIRSGNRWEVRNKLFRFASQKGFESDLIRKILDSELSQDY